MVQGVIVETVEEFPPPEEPQAVVRIMQAWHASVPQQFDGGPPEPGPPNQVSWGRQYDADRRWAFRLAVATVVAEPFLALGALLLGLPGGAIALVLGPASAGVIAVIYAGNGFYFGSSGRSPAEQMKSLERGDKDEDQDDA